MSITAKIILVGTYEEIFKKYSEQFANHRREFYNIIAVFNLESVGRTETMVATVLNKMEMHLNDVRTSEQMKATTFLGKIGGVDTLFADNRHHDGLQKIIGAKRRIDYEALEVEANRTSERIDRLTVIARDVQKVVHRIDNRMVSFAFL